MSESKYVAQGRKARRANEAKSSCRYTAKDIVRDWNAGWNSEDKKIVADQLQRAEEDAAFRWEDSTSYSRDERGKVEPREWTLLSSRLGNVSLSIRKVTGRWVYRVEGLTAYPIEHEIEPRPGVDPKAAAIVAFAALVATHSAALGYLHAILDKLPRKLPESR